MVVEEFRAAIPERGFVLVPFEDELFTAAESVALSKILGDAANQKVRLLPCRVKNPGEHRRCGGFAMRSADHDRVLARKKEFFERLGQRTIRNGPVEELFEFGIATRD